ncbi:MAG: glycosyltransferase family 39 protein [Planctomycetota bacterium]|nr:glycosyltransferase family 39 protein [Planctomycetota bacterium]
MSEPFPVGMRKWLRARSDYLILFALPLALLCIDDYWCFNQAGWIDSWLYLGYKRELPAYVSEWFPNTYYASRLTFLLIGHACHSLFPELMANYVDHLIWYYLGVYSLYFIVRSWTGRREALVSALLLGCHGWFFSAVGWDYPDGAGLSCQLLAFAFLTKAVRSDKDKVHLLAAGLAAGAMIHAQLFLVFFCPILMVYYVLLKPRSDGVLKGLFRFLAWFSIGFVLLTLIFGILNMLLGGAFLFFAPSFKFGSQLAGSKNPSLIDPNLWIPSARHLFVPILAAIVGSSYLVIGKWRQSTDRICAVVSIQYLAAAGIMILWQFKGQPMLQLYYYASYLMPTAFISILIPLFRATAAAEPESRVQRAGRIAAAIAACVLALLWFDNGWMGGNFTAMILPFRGNSLPWIVLFALAVVAAAALHFPARMAGRAVGLVAVGFAMGLSGSHYPKTAVPARDSYMLVVQAQDWVARESKDRKPLFWYGSSTPMKGHCISIASTFLWGFSLLNEKLPEVSSDDLQRIDPSVRIVVTTDCVENVKAALDSLSARGIQCNIKSQTQLKLGEDEIFLALIDIFPTGVLTGSKNPSGEILLEQETLAVSHKANFLHSYLGQKGPNAPTATYSETDRIVKIVSDAKNSTVASFGPFVAPETATYGFFLCYSYRAGKVRVRIRTRQNDQIAFESDSRNFRSGFINRAFKAPLRKGDVFYVVFESQEKYNEIEMTIYELWAWIP